MIVLLNYCTKKADFQDKLTLTTLQFIKTNYMKKIWCLLLTVFSTGLLFAQNEEVMIHFDNNMKTQDSSIIFVVVDELPVFNYKNCNSTFDCFSNYVSDSLNVHSFDCVGRLYIQFIVEPDSTISNAKIIRGLEQCSMYKEKIEKIIESMPKWIPGKQGGNAVRVILTMPIIFNPKDQ